MVAACAALMAITAGIWYSASVFFVALVQEFQQEYAVTAGVYSLFTVCYGISGMIAGELVDRFGARRIILAGGILVMLALSANSLAPTLGWLYASHGILVASGMAASGYVPVSVLLTRSFRRHCGLAIGTASAGVGIGILAIVPLAQFLIARLGWRMAYGALGCLAGGVILPVAWLGLPCQPFACPKPLARGVEQRGRGDPFGRTLRILLGAANRREFWLVAATFTLINSPIQLMLTHHVAHMVEAEHAGMLVAGIVAIVGFVSVPGKILWGYLSDRWWLETVYAAGVSCLVASIAILMSTTPGSSGWTLYAYAILMGLGYAVSPTLTPILGARFFAGPHFGAILGGLSVFYQTGGAVGVWLAGYSHDLTGNYQTAFAASILCAFAGLTCAWFAGPRRVRVPGGAPRPQASGVVTGEQ